MRSLIALCAAIPVAASLLLAGTTGKISGRITEKGGGALPGVNVMVVGTSLGTITGLDGEYVIINVPPGTHELKITLVGYSPLIVRQVNVTADRTTIVNTSLTSSLIEMQDIVVQAERPMVQKDLTATMAAVSDEDIRMLPVSNFLDVIAIQAGVVGSGNSMHVRGGRSGEVAYLIDGMSVRDPVLGRIGTSINNDAISELNLLTGTFSAEYGNAMSGVVNIVTKEGSSDFHGSIEGRTSNFGIPRYSDINENRVSATASGPILGENFGFFASGEREARGSWLPFGYLDIVSGIGKLNARILTSLKAIASWRYSQQYVQSYSHEWKYIPEQYLRTREYSRQGMVTLTHTLARNVFYDLRFSYLNMSYYSGIDKDTSQYIPSSNWTYLPVGTGVEFYAQADPVELIDNRSETFNLKGDVVWAINQSNELKAGFDVRKFNLSYFNVYDPKRTAPYITDFYKTPVEAAAYILDKIELAALVINIGMRFDYLNQQAPYRTDPLDPNSVTEAEPKMQWSPRLGVAHPITDRTSLHFAYGRFFQVPDYSRFYENAQYDIAVREPLFGDPNLDAERTTSYEVGVTHQFAQTVSASFVASYKDVMGLVGTQYYAPYVEGRYVGYTNYVNEAYSNIKGIEVRLDLRRTNFIAGTLNYTYSDAKGSASSQIEDYPGTTTSTLLYPLNWDKTHVINASVSLAFPQNFGPGSVGQAIFQNTYWNFFFRASSGYPYTPSGRDVGFVPKNSARMPWTYSLDFEFMKEFKIDILTLSIFAEILNLTDAKNVVAVYTDTGEPDQTTIGTHSEEYIRDPSNFGAPRRIRLGMGLRF
jgi:outer membrane receptor protein involved in Fe transport